MGDGFISEQTHSTWWKANNEMELILEIEEWNWKD